MLSVHRVAAFALGCSLIALSGCHVGPGAWGTGACGSGACGSGPCGPIALGAAGPACGGCGQCDGCGELYIDPWINHPPDCCDPCDSCGNYNGQSCGKCRSVFAGVKTIWGYRCDDGCDHAPVGCGCEVGGGCEAGCGCEAGPGCTGCDTCLETDATCGVETDATCGVEMDATCGVEMDATCGVEMDATCGTEPYVINHAASGPDSVVRIVEPPNRVMGPTTRARQSAPARTEVLTYPQDILRIFKNRSETARGRSDRGVF